MGKLVWAPTNPLSPVPSGEWVRVRGGGLLSSYFTGEMRIAWSAPEQLAAPHLRTALPGGPLPSPRKGRGRGGVS